MIDLEEGDISEIWPSSQKFHAPATKKRHLNVPAKTLMNEAGTHALKAFLSSLTAMQTLDSELIVVAKDRVSWDDRSKRLSKQKEGLKAKVSSLENANSYLKSKVDKLSRSVSQLEATQKEHVVDATEIGAYYSFLARLETMAEYFEGNHGSWNLEETRATFEKLYPPGAPPSSVALLASLPLACASDEELTSEIKDLAKMVAPNIPGQTKTSGE